MPHSPSTGATTPQNGLEWWNINLPEHQWTEKCPIFLLEQGEKNIWIMSGSEKDYHTLTWSECQQVVAENRINHFQRSPLELRRYIQYMHQLKQEYGSVFEFVKTKRLNWSATTTEDAPFSNPDDYKILYNDWPYGIDSQITHLVVWTKFVLEDDPETGFLTQESHNLIEKFVVDTFCGRSGVERRNLIWFKNWKSLKSIHALEHFHVMIYQADEDFSKNITNGDRSMSEIVRLGGP